MDWTDSLDASARIADLPEEIEADIAEEIAENGSAECRKKKRSARHGLSLVVLQPSVSRFGGKTRFRCSTILSAISATRADLVAHSGLSLISIGVIALCIGAATSLFTVLHSVLLRPLPFRDPERLVMIFEHFRDSRINAQEFNYNSVAPGDYLRLAQRRPTVLKTWRRGATAQFNLTGESGELPEQVSARGGSWNLFPLLGFMRPSGARSPRAKTVPTERAVLLTWGHLQTTVWRGFIDCRQADPSRREALYRSGHTSEIVHLSRCEGPGLGSVPSGLTPEILQPSRLSLEPGGRAAEVECQSGDRSQPGGGGAVSTALCRICMRPWQRTWRRETLSRPR